MSNYGLLNRFKKKSSCSSDRKRGSALHVMMNPAALKCAMTLDFLKCPNCTSDNFVKNGHIHNGKQNHICKDCGRQFVEDPQNIPISEGKKDLIDKLLLERLALAAIARVTGVSESWLQKYVNDKFENIEQEVEVEKKDKGFLRIECDEMWSFVGHKGNKVWIWLAIDQATGEIVGVYIGSRDKRGAQGLWDSLPAVYRGCLEISVPLKDLAFWLKFELSVTF